MTSDLEKMSIEEKIQAMESLWDNLCRHAEGELSPSWHADILLQRGHAESTGEAQFLDWNDVKKKLREES